MNTATHILLAQAVFKREDKDRSGWVSFFGAVTPDFFIAIFLAVSLFQGVPNDELWSVNYFQEPWKTIGSISSSFILWMLLILASTLALSKGSSSKLRRVGKYLQIFSISAFLHIVLDFLTHADDAYSHFWPISDWKFHSPFSYWDVEHNAQYVMPVEGLLVLAAVYLLWSKSRSKIYKGLLSLAILFGAVSLIAPIFI